MLHLPATVENARRILRFSAEHNLNVDERIHDIFNRIERTQRIPGFNFTLKPFQAEGVAWLESQLGTGLLADEPGTGKTVQVMAYAHKNQRFPMLVVCPGSLKLNWRNEIIAMTGHQYRINIIGRSYNKKQTSARRLCHPNVTYSKFPQSEHDIYIVNYEALGPNTIWLEGLGLRFMVVDESHKIKNPSANRAKAVIRLATGWGENKNRWVKRLGLVEKQPQKSKIGSGIPSVVMISGTPMVNRPKELWTTVNTIGPYVPAFSKWNKFHFRYCNPQSSSFGTMFNGASNTEELNELLTQYIMLRRLKEDVLPELPDKSYRVLPLEFDRKEYDRVENGFKGINWNEGIRAIMRMGSNAPSGDEAVVAIHKLSEIAAHSKLDAAVEWITNYLETGNKLVVFAHHRRVIDRLKQEIEQHEGGKNTVVVIHGGIQEDEREVAVAAFQHHPTVKVIIVSINTGGVGLTLTAASAVAFVQIPWTPGDLGQCIDRIHRIGQTAKTVDIYVLVAEDTIEEKITDMLLSKGRVLDEVLDGGRQVNGLDLSL